MSEDDPLKRGVIPPPPHTKHTRTDKLKPPLIVEMVDLGKPWVYAHKLSKKGVTQEEACVEAICSRLSSNTLSATATRPLSVALRAFIQQLPDYAPPADAETENSQGDKSVVLTAEQQSQRKKALEKFLLPKSHEVMRKILLTTEYDPLESKENFPKNWSDFESRMELFKVELKKSMLNQIKMHNSLTHPYLGVTMDDVDALFKPANEQPDPIQKMLDHIINKVIKEPQRR